jgi:hypothetical protein
VADKQHVAELFVEMVEEQFKADMEMLDEFSRVDGRPMFHAEVSGDEELAMYMEPHMRIKMLENKLRLDGSEEMDKYRRKMDERLMQYQARLRGVENA